MISVGTILSNSVRGPRGMLLPMASLGLASTSLAQVCLEATACSPVGSSPASLSAADLDGDGDVDVAVADLNGSAVYVRLNDGRGSFATQGPFAVGPTPGSLTSADLDADGDVDLAVPNGFTGTVSVLANLGNGTFAPHVQYAVGAGPTQVRSADLDGDGFVDLMVMCYAAGNAHVLVNLGNGTFAPGVPLAIGSSPVALDLADLDGDGDADLATADYGGTATIHVNLGNGTFAQGAQLAISSFQIATSVSSGDVDVDGDVDLVVGSRSVPSPFPFPFGFVSVFLNQGNGTFAPAATYGASSANGPAAIADLDGDGLPDLAAAGMLAPGLNLWLNQGNGAFSTQIQVSIDPQHGAVIHADLDQDGDEDLVLGSGNTPTGVCVMRNCGLSGTAICAGDGSGAACPCGNQSPPGGSAGCLNSSGLAGTLRGTGSATIANDQLVLVGTGLQNSSALYFQGTSAVSAGAGVPFGDGLRCVGGSVRRLGVKVASNNGSQYPGPGDDPVSVRGAVTAPGQRIYQVWYRDAASFCTTGTFNLTNALSVNWRP
jgi:hypothetical protein